MSALPNSLRVGNFITAKKTKNLPPLKEFKYNFETNDIETLDGQPLYVCENEALKVWLFFALITERFRYQAYSKNYGNEVWGLLGEVISDEFKKSEIKRYCKECIMANPYVKSINSITVDVDGSKAIVDIAITSIYADEVVDVTVEL